MVAQPASSIVLPPLLGCFGCRMESTTGKASAGRMLYFSSNLKFLPGKFSSSARTQARGCLSLVTLGARYLEIFSISSRLQRANAFHALLQEEASDNGGTEIAIYLLIFRGIRMKFFRGGASPKTGWWGVLVFRVKNALCWWGMEYNWNNSTRKLHFCCPQHCSVFSTGNCSVRHGTSEWQQRCIHFLSLLVLLKFRYAELMPVWKKHCWSVFRTIL